MPIEWSPAQPLNNNSRHHPTSWPIKSSNIFAVRGFAMKRVVSHERVSWQRSSLARAIASAAVVKHPYASVWVADGRRPDRARLEQVHVLRTPSRTFSAHFIIARRSQLWVPRPPGEAVLNIGVSTPYPSSLLVPPCDRHRPRPFSSMLSLVSISFLRRPPSNRRSL